MNKKNVIKMFNNFTIKELFSSCSSSEVIECVKNCSIDRLLVLLQVLDAFRDYCEFPIKITSSYRNVYHNKNCGGSPTSQHMLGEAIDFQSIGETNNTMIKKLQKFLKVTPLSVFVGQVIFYNSFIHIALRSTKHNSVQYYDKRTNQNLN